MIENSGFPDQTYDTWAATGTSAYSGGLWVAAVSAIKEMAKILDIKDDFEYFSELETRAKAAYDKLFNGEYFRYDTSGKYDHIIMADQLAGQWYARACNLPSISTPSNIRKTLSSIYDNNVMKFMNGELGAVNGFNTATGSADVTSMQSYEVWTGTTFSIAACMLQEKLDKQGWATAESVCKCIYEKFGYWFQAPEAWDQYGHFRSFAYMRPLSIWGIQWCIEKGIAANNNDD